MLDIITKILNTIIDAASWYLDSGLCESTGIAVGKIMNYATAVLIPLIWEYYFTIEGRG